MQAPGSSVPCQTSNRDPPPDEGLGPATRGRPDLDRQQPVQRPAFQARLRKRGCASARRLGLFPIIQPAVNDKIRAPDARMCNQTGPETGDAPCLTDSR